MAGAPGAVILYGLLAVLLWPAPERPARRLAGCAPARSARWRPGWPGRCCGPASAYDSLLAASRAGLAALVSGQGAGEPGWLAAIDRSAGRQLGAHDAAVSAALAVIFAVIAVAVFIPAATRPVLAVAVALALAIWLVGEDLGDVFTGQGTDPNTGPLLVLLALAYWPRRPLEWPLPARGPAALARLPWPWRLAGAGACPARRVGGCPVLGALSGPCRGAGARRGRRLGRRLGPRACFFPAGNRIPGPLPRGRLRQVCRTRGEPVPVIFLGGQAPFIEQAF